MDYKQEVVNAGLRLIRDGLTIETWGNVSMRNPKNGLIYLTPSAMPYDQITKEDILVMTPEGQIREGFRKPTIEWGLHLAVYAARPDAQVILHTHPLHSQIFGVLRREIPVIHDEMAQTLGGPVRVAEYALPGSEALAENAVRALGSEGKAILLANHGAVVIGAAMDKAFRACKALEMAAEIYYKALTIGPVYEISPEDTAYMKDFAENRYKQ